MSHYPYKTPFVNVSLSYLLLRKIKNNNTNNNNAQNNEWANFVKVVKEILLMLDYITVKKEKKKRKLLR